MKLLPILTPLIFSASSLVLAHHHDDHDALYVRDHDELASHHSRHLFDRSPHALAEAYHAGYLAARDADPEPERLERRMYTYECVACGKKLLAMAAPNYCPNSACPGHKDRDPHTVRFVKVAGKGGR
ncbi:hypothetical protein MMC26_003974 [Xylographa opegraphella]|nr:hypothetical protein [Xylographa opegraphella]